MEYCEIYLIGGGDDERGTLRADNIDRMCRVRFTFRGRTIEAKASDYFDAFCEIRVELQRERLIPFCYGASLNVWPSGMGRDMGLGLKAYKTNLGEPATETVDIFSSGHDVIPCYPSAQKRFHEEWIATMQARCNSNK